MTSVIDLPQDLSNAGSGGVSVEFRGISHVYGQGARKTEALRDINFTARPGEFVALLGPSGCGKSTLLTIAAGLVRSSSGTVLIDGIPVTKPATELGFVFQEATLLEWRTALSNIMLQAEARSIDRAQALKRAKELMAQTGISGFEEAYPAQLSGGMRQRVSICRALLHNPPMLFMDEPFGALDAMTREQMIMDTQQIWMDGRKTVLFVTHDIPEALLLADRIVVLGARPGRILKIYEVGGGRPRAMDDLSTKRFVELQHEVRQLLREAGAFARH
ncbi:MAG: ABC transporter ATP-binding protein [Mesorhizobium sp.]